VIPNKSHLFQPLPTKKAAEQE